MNSINYSSTRCHLERHHGSNTEVLCRQSARISGQMGVGSKVEKASKRKKDRRIGSLKVSICLAYLRKHLWSKGRIPPFQGGDPGSSPGGCTFLSGEGRVCVKKTKRRAQQGSNLQPPDPKSGALPIAPCALHLVMSGEGG